MNVPFKRIIACVAVGIVGASGKLTSGEWGGAL